MNRNSLIERYFEDNLTPQEKLDFDHLMETDPSFSEEVSFERNTKAAVTLEARKELKTKLQALESENNKKSNRKTWLSIAAMILVLLGVSMFFLNQNPTADQLYADYFEPYPNTVAPIVRDASQESEEIDAFAAYEQGDYKEAAARFQALSETSDEEYLSFYRAISFMELDQMKEAEQIFTSTTWSSDYNEKAKWYLAMNYIQQNKITQAKVLLSEIVKDQSYKHEKAEKLLQKVEKLK